MPTRYGSSLWHCLIRLSNSSGSPDGCHDTAILPAGNRPGCPFISMALIASALSAYISLTLEPTSQVIFRKFEQQIATFDAVMACHLMSGSHDSCCGG
ncbi:hypothetical protein DZA65_00018 [Dickeya dianthicola]|nr:hypothetical protein DZA65_00018 [Dickeya dianthicola]